MNNFQNLLKQAQKMQAKVSQMQAELADRKVEASAGGGMVTAVVNGKQELVALRLEREVVNPDDTEMLEDLILAAVNEAMARAGELASEEMRKITGGLNLPGLL
ncbi:MAG: YbaB/EbfC family nucleoid-associated protein [Gemmatimonadetes bacterium]|nr:YbaB/EbfC family nucleoid-associated protein [Gemmatimonadota bacterium]